MPLVPHAIFKDPDVVWDHLCVEETIRVERSVMMEMWINYATAMLEQYLNRPIIPRPKVDEKHDGNGKAMMLLNDHPILYLSSLRVYTNDWGNFWDINVMDPPIRHIDLDNETGRVVLLPDAPLGRFIRGVGNIVASYTVGLPDDAIAACQQAAIDLIAIRNAEVGRNPLEDVRTDSIIGTAHFNKSQPNTLPWNITQIVDQYRRRQV